MTKSKFVNTSSAESIDEELRDRVATPLPNHPPPLSRSVSKDEFTEQECPFASEQHEGKEIINAVMELSPDAVYNLMFVDPNFMANIYAERKYYDMEYTPWEKDSSSGDMFRKLTYTATLPSKALGPSTSFVTEIQTLSSVGRKNDLYVVNCESWNTGIPYAENFRMHVHYCFLRGPYRHGKETCRFSYYATVKFRKNTFFVVKNMIEKNVMIGLENVAKDFLAALLAHASQGATGVKKRRRESHARNASETTVKKAEAEIPTTGKWKSRICSWILFCLLLLIGVLNGYLFKRLLSLEEVGRRPISIEDRDASATFDGDKIDMDFLIEEQERILTWYNAEWNNQLRDSLQALKTAEVILKSTMSTLPAYEAQRKKFLTQWQKFLERTKTTQKEEDISLAEKSEDEGGIIELSRT